jgi:hypothetical protein
LKKKSACCGAGYWSDGLVEVYDKKTVKGGFTVFLLLY